MKAVRRFQSGGRRAVVLALMLISLLAGCKRDAAMEPGVVAVVDGAPIRLADLESRHDLGRLGAPGADNPQVERLRAEYGAVLADMIVARLVRQELARLRLSVTTDEMAVAEAKVRADYPGDAFERLLLEERIDVARWREVLGDRLALEKFTREVLRRNARVEVSEAAAYYKEHSDAFARPARVRLMEVRGAEAEAVKGALAAYRKSGQRASLEKGEGLLVREAVLPEKNLTPAWREAVKGLKPGEASSLLGTDTERFFLVVLERQPATVLDPAKAYPWIESALAARKLEKAMAAWLAEALAAADISVNRRLLAGSEPDAAAAAGEGPHNEADLAREEAAVRDALAAQAKKILVGKPAARNDFQKERLVSAPAGVDSFPDKGHSPESLGPQAQTGMAPGPTTDWADALPPAIGSETPAGPSGAEATAPPVPAQEGIQAKSSQAVSPETASTPEPDTTIRSAAPAAPAAAPEPDARSSEPAASPTTETVEFSAVKASWILCSVDGGPEERTYLKPGQPYRIVFAHKLIVRLGSPSEVTYRAGGRETTVTVGKKESRILEFP